jgi:type IV pilus assembly protein PilW
MKSKFNRHPRRAAGLSLVELMIALTLGTLLMLGVVEIFTGTKATYNLQEGLSRVQENGRIGMNLMAREIRMGGLLGCATSTNTTARIIRASGAQIDPTFDSRLDPAAADRLIANPQVGIQGFEFTGTDLASATYVLASTPVNAASADFAPVLPTSPMFDSGIRPVRGSDVLVVRYTREPSVEVDRSVANAASVEIEPTSLVGSTLDEVLPSGSIFAVSDCIRGTVFQGSRAGNVLTRFAAGTGTPGNVAGSGPPVQYGKNATVGERVTMAFFVGANGRGGYSLYRGRYTFSAAGVATIVKDELIEGVESLQLMFGLPSIELVERGTGVLTPVYTSPVTHFGTAAQIADTAYAGFGDAAFIAAGGTVQARALLLRQLNVRSVRVGLLLTSGENSRTEIDTETYRLFGSTAATGVDLDPPDNLSYRDVFETTIQGRNLTGTN